MVLIGHNGAGKSTFIQFLLGFYTSPNQHPFLKNFLPHKSAFLNKSIGYAPEATLLDLSMNALDYLKMIAALRGIRSFDTQDILDRVSLSVDPNAPLKSYSKGMRQRFLLALAMLGDTDVLVLDEPTSGLDEFGTKAVESLLLELKNRHEFVLCTHSLEFAYRFDDEIWIFFEGTIVYQGRPSSLDELQRIFYQYTPSRIE